MKKRSASFIPMAQRPGVFTQPWRTLRSIGALMMREMTTTYGRSPGGYIWAFLEPIGTIVVLTAVISLGLRLRQPSLGVNFAMFYATGLLSFSMYQRTQGKVAQSISYSRALLRYQAIRFFDTIAARVLLNFITQASVMLIIFAALTSIYDTRTQIDIRWVMLSMVMAASLGVGLGLINALLMPLFPVYASLFGILTTPLFFLSGILFIYEDLPAGAQPFAWFNPLIHVTGMMRRGFYPQYDAEFVSPMYVFTVALILAVIGFALISRYFRFVVDRS